MQAYSRSTAAIMVAAFIAVMIVVRYAMAALIGATGFYMGVCVALSCLATAWWLERR